MLFCARWRAAWRGNSLDIIWVGRVEYTSAWALQNELAALRREGSIPDMLLLLEHPPVITLGRAANRSHLLADTMLLDGMGIHTEEVDRGGDITYHGPGQLVGYFIVDLGARGRDLHR